MGSIRVLDSRVAEKIAAGEVIERPASVVKELVENSIDAGATEILVALEDGGKSLIEVLDNGHGMGQEDLKLCVLRHATSKLAVLDDLERISTLGFRGEALPSVAAVSDLTILSRTRDNTSGSTALCWVAGSVENITFGHFLGSSHGTRIQARGLFSQVPARLKFLRSSGAEVAQVREWVERLALAHPACGFRVVSDDRTLLQLKAATEADRVKTILSGGEDFPIQSTSGEDRGIRLRAHWLQGLSLPQAKRLVQVVNGRSLKDRVLQQAIMQPFRQALLPGQFPAVALFIEIDPSLIDVNVHPTKTEVRFLDSGQIFKSVSRLLEKLISDHGAPAFAPGPSQPLPARTWPTETQPVMSNSLWSAREPAPATFENDVDLPASVPVPQPPYSRPVQASGAELLAQGFTMSRYLGVLFSTYLLYDLGQEIGLIDQHAAHERIRYEKLKQRIQSPSTPLMTQALLLPEAVAFAPEYRTHVESGLEAFTRMGFEVEIFGETSLIFRSVPAEWGTDNLHQRLQGLLERWIDRPANSELLVDESVFEKLASEACHSAIRAGDRLEPLEADALVRDLFSCEHPWNCPHGRPTTVRVPRTRLEEWFQRKV